MRIFTSVLLVATVATVTSAQSSSSLTPTPFLSSTSDSSSMPAALAAITECSTTQLDEAQAILTSNQRQKQCETALNLESSTMLQVTTASATEMCNTASCKAALLELYNAMPNCRYNSWGLQYSAKKLLEYCGITPTKTTDLVQSSKPINWSVTSGSDSFAKAGINTSPTVSNPPAASSESATSSGASATTTTSTILAVFAMTAGLVAAF